MWQIDLDTLPQVVSDDSLNPDAKPTVTILATLEKVDKNRVKERLRVPFLVFLCVVVIAVFATMDLPKVIKSVIACGWPETPGISIRTGAVRVRLGKVEDPLWNVFVNYSYKVGDREYINDVISYQNLYYGIPGFESGQAQRRFHPGAALTVRYNQHNPQESCLEPEPRWDTAFFHFVIYALIAGLFYISTYPPVKPEEEVFPA